MSVIFSKEATYNGRKRFEAKLADAAWNGPKVIIEQIYGISKHGATKGQRLGPATEWGATRTGAAPGAYYARGTKTEMKDFAKRYLTVKSAKQNPMGAFLWEQAKKTPKRMWDIHTVPLKVAYAHPEMLTLLGPKGVAAAAAIHGVKGALKQNPERTKKMTKNKWIPYSDADATAWAADRSPDKRGSYRLLGTGSALVTVSPIDHYGDTRYIPGVYLNGRWLPTEESFKSVETAKKHALAQYAVQARYEGYKVNPQKKKARKNPDFGVVDRVRARRIVKLAAKSLRASMAKSWLTLDERGTWEATALKDLQSDKLQAKAAELGLTEKEVDEQIATYLGYLATDATLRSAKKNPKSFEVLDTRTSAKGYDFTERHGVVYFRKDGNTIGNVRKGVSDAAGHWFPEWSATVPRARDGAIKLPKALIAEALKVIGYRRQNPMPPVLAEMRQNIAAARKALANGQREKARSLAQAALDARAESVSHLDATVHAKAAELAEAARYVLSHASAPRKNPFVAGDRVTDDYGRRGIVHRKLPQNSYDVAWNGYGGRPMRAKEEALRRANPRVRYYSLPASNFTAGAVWEQGDVLYARPEQYRLARTTNRPGKRHVRGALQYLPPGRYEVLNYGEWRGDGPLRVAPLEKR